MDFQLAELPHVIELMHKHNKKPFIHLDLIKGLASDQYGAIYCIQALKIKGIITSKPRVIALCKKRDVLGILRIFLKDNHSLKQSLQMIEECKPDVIEVLPFMPQILPHIKNHYRKPIFMGGLITNATSVDLCLDNGAQAITTSSISLWEHYTINEERKI